MFHIYMETKGYLNTSNVKRYHYLTNRQGLKYAKDHPGLVESVPFCADKKLARVLPASKMACIKYLLDESDKDHSESFFEEIKYGANLEHGDATLALRNRILTAIQEGDPLPVKMKMILVLKAWAAHLDGKHVSNLFARKEESNPRVAGEPFMKGSNPTIKRGK